MPYAEIVFSKQQQSALLGHAISNPRVYETAVAFGVTPLWFTEHVNGARVWKALAEFTVANGGRHPTVSELKSTSLFTKEEPKIVAACDRAVDEAIGDMAELGYDTIVKQIHEWARSWTMRSSIEKTMQLWNRGDLELAMGSYIDGVSAMERLDFQSLVSRCQDAYSRAANERAERLEQAPRILKYGVHFLDEATGGISPNDLILIGAKTGAGKTQLVAQIAGYNAIKGKRVALFALEAEENEIERRLKFAFLAQMYRKKVEDSGVPGKDVDYANWRLGQCEEELGPFELQANRLMSGYKTLNTIYRKGGDYGIEQLERDIVKLAPTTDLIIVDHLHYVDLDGDNENAAMKSVVKKLRDLALGLGKPIILVAHMRKTQGGKYAPLIPSIEDFHGSSDIIKIATTAIILAPAYDVNWNDPEKAPDYAKAWGTYFRIAKCRLDGSRLRFCAVTFFDTLKGNYRKEYAIGRLTGNDCEWEPLEPGRKPTWASNGVLRLLTTKK